MENVIQIQIETASNLFIGGMPMPFEIGGIDQQTVTDQNGNPYIPASSFKGALRNIVHEDQIDHEDQDGSNATEIAGFYADYLEREQEKNEERLQELHRETEEMERIKKRYEEAKDKVSAEYLFGIKGFNNTPKLLFSDLVLVEKKPENVSCFSIDMKNSIEETDNGPVSNPRSYKTARSGLVFQGEIRLYKLELLGKDAAEACREYVKDQLQQFNRGIYRLGNSKSRGYGKVKVTILGEESGASQE